MPVRLRSALRLLAAATLLWSVAACALPVAGDAPTPAHSGVVRGGESWQPPWQGEATPNTGQAGLEFTIPEADNLADFHGDPGTAKLVLYVGGNSFFAIPELVRAFEALHPQYRGAVYWETLPPGLLTLQMKGGGTVTVGNMNWTVKADVYLAGLNEVRANLEAGLLDAPATPYVTNTLTIMVARGNPAGVRELADLGRSGIRLAMPNPTFEGVARQIQDSLRKAGGDALVTRVYATKVKDGTSVLTQIHHRQTPLWLMQGRVQAGVTWQSEALYQERIGHPIAHVDIPAAQNTVAVYAAALARGAPHASAAREWLDFIRSPAAFEILAPYGFQRYVDGS